jgi:hypothetical protein
MDENKTALTKSEIVSFEKLKQKWKELSEEVFQKYFDHKNKKINITLLRI